jgi:fructose-1,6-bisphosphatase/inositol monophosphatase family enzyme
MDRSIEESLRNKIAKNFPSDAIVGEEFPDRSPDDPNVRWYLDPIDGTAAYSMQLPIWTVCIGLACDMRPMAGVLGAPALDEEYHGVASSYVRKNGRELSEQSDVPKDWTAESLLCIPSNAHRRFEIEFEGKCRSLGSSAYHLALVLDGRAVGALLNRLHIWDLAAPLGMVCSNDFRLETLSGGTPDWGRLEGGKRSRGNLIFARKENLRAIRRRVESGG